MKGHILFLFISLPYFGSCLLCYNCQNGYTTSQICSNQLGPGYYEECDDSNSECYESVQWFNGGALRLAIRGCWTPPNNLTEGGFCENYNNPVGTLVYCRNCTEDLCNTNKIFMPVYLPKCYAEWV